MISILDVKDHLKMKGGCQLKKKVIIYSDYICPFCYIGKKRIERLQEEFDIEVEWRGLQIHPETPLEGQTLQEMGLNHHYIEMVIEHVNRLAAEIDLLLKPPPKISNSKWALLLCEFAKEHGKFEEYHSEIFKAYWEDGQDIGDSEVLFDIIDRIGLDYKKAQEFIKRKKGSEKMDEFLLEAKAWEINSVPTFIIGNIKIEGAQPYELFKKAMENYSCL
jgi:predicted DsbA family dithiol-disulfide isomerase